MKFNIDCLGHPLCYVYGQKRMELAGELLYHVRAFDQDGKIIYVETITVRKGLMTDGASVPRFLHWWLPPYHREYIQAAVLHDYLYETHYSEHLAERIGLHAKHGRWLADQLFLTALKGTKKWRNYALYWAVRLFGRHAWNTDVKPLPPAASGKDTP